MSRIATLAALLVVVSVGVSYAQAGGGYVVGGRDELPVWDIQHDVLELPLSPNRMDVKAIGMGKAQVADGRSYNAMMDNPALLARERFTFDLVGLQTSIPVATLDAASFVSDNKGEFADGQFFSLIREGYAEYEMASTVQGRIAAIRKINQGLEFPNQLLLETIGDKEDPQVHGLGLIPNFQIQQGNWGVSFHTNAQVGFMVNPGNSINQLLSLSIPEHAQELGPQVQRELTEVIASVFDANGNLSSEGLPQVFAISCIDAVGGVGYARQVSEVSEDLWLGANLKILHRRFSNKNVDAANLDDILSEVREDFDAHITGVTADVGGLYKYEPTGTEIGMAVQNLIPVQTVESTARFRFVQSEQYYVTDMLVNYLNGLPYEDASEEPWVGYYDQAGAFVPHAEGDTLLYVESQVQNQRLPMELQVPMLLNLGVMHPINDNWDVALDWVDVLSQDSKFISYTERFRIGTEYRLMANVLALRAGIADERLTGGFGVNFKLLQFDAAYAYDNFIEDNTYFLQFKLGW